MIDKCCENCIFNEKHYAPFDMVCNDCKEAQKNNDTCFIPREEVVRADESIYWQFERQKVVNDTIDCVIDLIRRFKPKMAEFESLIEGLELLLKV